MPIPPIPVRKINHPLHIVLSVLTGGLWLIPYAIILAMRPGYERRVAQLEALRVRHNEEERLRLAAEQAAPPATA